jgi:hypothetical protein
MVYNDLVQKRQHLENTVQSQKRLLSDLERKNVSLELRLARVSFPILTLSLTLALTTLSCLVWTNC